MEEVLVCDAVLLPLIDVLVNLERTRTLVMLRRLCKTAKRSVRQSTILKTIEWLDPDTTYWHGPFKYYTGPDPPRTRPIPDAVWIRRLSRTLHRPHLAPTFPEFSGHWVCLKLEWGGRLVWVPSRIDCSGRWRGQKCPTPGNEYYFETVVWKSKIGIRCVRA